MAWYESTLSVGQVFKEQPTTIAHFHNDDGKPRTNTDDDPPINHTGDEAPARLQLGGKRWEHVRNVERIERELDLANLTIETKKKSVCGAFKLRNPVVFNSMQTSGNNVF